MFSVLYFFYFRYIVYDHDVKYGSLFKFPDAPQKLSPAHDGIDEARRGLQLIFGGGKRPELTNNIINNTTD